MSGADCVRQTAEKNKNRNGAAFSHAASARKVLLGPPMRPPRTLPPATAYSCARPPDLQHLCETIGRRLFYLQLIPYFCQAFPRFCLGRPAKPKQAPQFSSLLVEVLTRRPGKTNPGLRFLTPVPFSKHPEQSVRLPQMAVGIGRNQPAPRTVEPFLPVRRTAVRYERKRIRAFPFVSRYPSFLVGASLAFLRKPRPLPAGIRAVGHRDCLH